MWTADEPLAPLARRLRTGEVTPTDYLDNLDERVERVEPTVRAFLDEDGRFDHLRDQLEDDAEHVEAIDRAFTRMDTLIEEILTLAREGELVEHREIVRLSSVTMDCWTVVETADAELLIDDDMVFEADPSRLKRALENLLRNAVEHAGPEVTVTVGAFADRSGFYVADDGPGIHESDRDDVFERGYTTSETGTGYRHRDRRGSRMGNRRERIRQRWDAIHYYRR